MAPLAEAEELEHDPLGSPEEQAHVVLQLLVAPLEHAVQGPQVLDRRRVQEEVLGKPRQKGFELVCGKHG